MAETPSRTFLGTAGRFVVAGVANTLVTAALLSLLSQVIDQRVAYTIVFVLGVALSTLLAGRFVFRTNLTPTRTAAYVAVYVGVYLVGLGVTAAMMHFGVPSWASGAVVLITAPLGFLGGSLILGGPTGPDSPASR
jgi:putative flippase GtrA